MSRQLSSPRLGMRPGRMLRFGKDPELVPEVVPDGKEAAGDKLTDSRIKSEPALERVKDKVVEQESIEDGIDDVAPGRESNLAGLLSLKYPIPLQQEIKRYADSITDKVGPEEADVIIQQDNQDIAAPKPHAAADHIFDELHNQLPGFLFYHDFIDFRLYGLLTCCYCTLFIRFLYTCGMGAVNKIL